MELVIRYKGEIIKDGRVEIILRETDMIVNVIRGNDELIATSLVDASVKQDGNQPNLLELS